MKIIRFLSNDSSVYYGVYEPDNLRETRIIAGDILGDIQMTDMTRPVKKLLAPVLPPNIIALGLNYGKHAEETGIQYPELPVIFLKATNTVIGPGETILLPKAGPDEVDYEAELAVVIARKAKNIRPENVFDYVLGYTCANDVSARDWQIRKQKKQWARGKSFDTFCPLGPCLVTRDEIENPQKLKIKTILNGKVMQDSTTEDMYFDIRTIISDLSMSMTLFPGTVILTGTPEGVGFTRQPPVFLRDGDLVTVEIEHIGELSNPVAKER